MGFKVEDIRKLQNPYLELGSGDSLAEHREELNKLEREEMVSLSSRMVLECPESDLRDFGHAIEALRSPQDDIETFHEVLEKAYEVRQRITSLIDIRNEQPHRFILDAEFNEELFNDYNELALNVLKTNETDIATRLALTTPETDRSKLARNIRNIFPDSVFSTKVGAAFTVRRNIEDLLLSDEPEDFFTSRDFSVDLCLEYSKLFSLLKGHEKEIGEKLSLIESDKTRSDIGRKLEQLNAAAHDQENPFRLIASAMAPNQQKHEPISYPQEKPALAQKADASPEIVAAATTLLANSNSRNNNGLFNSPVRQRKPEVQQTLVEDDSSTEEESDEEGNYSCCGLFK